MINAIALLGPNDFKNQAQGLVVDLNRAALAASETGRRYEVIVDIAKQGYILREISSANLADIIQEEVIDEHLFTKDARIKYVKFDDMQSETATEGWARFRCGKAGWQAGGKIVLVDASGNEYSIVVNRINKMITLANGDVEILQPQDDVPF
jgi:hypothetical protein